MSGVNLKGRVAVVTGASLGIGRAAAVALGRAGAHVVVNYRSHAEAAEEVVQAIRDAGARAIAVQADVADLVAVEQMIQQAVDEFGKVDIAISNAAFSDREPFYEADMEGFRRTVDVTMWGAFHLLRSASRQMIEQGTPGVVVLVSSPHAFIPAPRSMAYNMSKAALDHMGKTAAIELAEHRIRVNMIQPGWTDTPGERKFASEDTLQRAGVPPRQVRLDQLVTTKDTLQLATLLDEDSTFFGDLFAHVVEWNGDYYLETGLHRALRAALQQRNVLHARVVAVQG